MKLEILSMSDAIKYLPRDRTHMIRIFDSIQNPMYYTLKNMKQFNSIKNYHFADAWPSDFKEYDWVDFNDNNCVYTELFALHKKIFPKVTEDVFLKSLESAGKLGGRMSMFNPDIAKKIKDDYEKISWKIDTVIIHCHEGKNRAPAIGKAMNEIYDWGIEKLEESFPMYRRYIYETMKRQL